MIYRAIGHINELGVGQSGNNKSLFASEVLARYWIQHTATHDLKTVPGRPRIYELLGRQSSPVAAQPDDKRAGGRVKRRNSAALIGRDPETPRSQIGT